MATLGFILADRESMSTGFRNKDSIFEKSIMSGSARVKRGLGQVQKTLQKDHR